MEDQRTQALGPSRQPSARGHQQQKVKGRVREQFWPGTLMGLGVFIGLFSFFTVGFWTALDPDLFFRGFLLLCFVGNLLPYLHSGSRWGMERLEWFLFNLLAVGPIATSLLLWLNFIGHGAATTSEHGVSHVDVGGGTITYHFADGHLADHPLARSVYRDPGDRTGNTIRVTEAVGLFGVPVVLRKEVVGQAY